MFKKTMKRPKDSIQVSLSVNESVKLMVLLKVVGNALGSAEGNVKGKDSSLQVWEDVFNVLKRQMPPEINVITEFSDQLAEIVGKEQTNG